MFKIIANTTRYFGEVEKQCNEFKEVITKKGMEIKQISPYAGSGMMGVVLFYGKKKPNTATNTRTESGEGQSTGREAKTTGRSSS